MIPIQIGMNGPVVSAELLIFPFPLLPKKMLCVMMMTGIDSFTFNTNRPIWMYNLRIYLKDIQNKIFSFTSLPMEFISFLTMQWVPVFQADCIVSMKMHSVKDQGSMDSHLSKNPILIEYIWEPLSGLWANTYAATNMEEYFAVGTQCFFNNSRKGPEGSDGVHNHIWTRDQLRDYDPGLYNFMLETFPCQNELIQRCDDQSQANKHLWPSKIYGS